jgi:hypothetical protein
MRGRRDRMIHLRLDEGEFAQLVSGAVVEQEADVTHQGVVMSAFSPVCVRLILSDIGYSRMLQAIGAAMTAEEGKR